MSPRLERRLSRQGFFRPASCLTMILSILMSGALPGLCEATKQEAVLVAEDGTTAPLIVAKDAPPHTAEAVEELARLIEKISGHKPQILNAPPHPLPSSTIWVGPHPALAQAMPGVDFQLTKPEETLYVSQGGQVAILGKDKMINETQTMSGTANAVYSFAQEVLGVRWLWPGELGEDTIASKTIRVPSQSVRFAPIFVRRLIFQGGAGPSRKIWEIRQRLAYDSLGKSGGVSFEGWWEKYGQTHPEYFALQPDGTRDAYPFPEQAKICEGEPKVWKQWLENVVEARQKDPIISVVSSTQNDGSNSGICVDPRSKAWDEPGAPLQQYYWKGKQDTDVATSDRIVRFANKLGEMLEERFPNDDLKVVAMPYGPSKPAPMKARPRKNVIIYYVGQFPTSADKWREMEKAQFAEWGDKVPFMLYRPNLFYYSGGWHGLPVIIPHNTAEDFRFLADHNCKGIVVDGTPSHWGTQSLQYYVMAQFAWNPYQDVDPMVEEFCRRAFGPAAADLRAYYRLMEQTQLAVLNHPQWFPGMGTTRDPLSEVILPVAYSPEFLDKADRILAAAAKTLEDAPEFYRQRLDLIQRGQEFTRLMMDTILTMNEVRNSEGRNFESVEKAVALVKARETFFQEEEVRAKAADRPPAVASSRLENTWIKNRTLENWLGPVSEEYLQAAAAAKKTGVSVTSHWKDKKAPAAVPTKVRLASPTTLRWTGAAGDRAWQNPENWEALGASGQWVPAPEPPEKGAKVELGDAVARPGPQVLQLSRDVELASLRINSSVPTNTYRIENRPDPDGGIDADSARVFALILSGAQPIVQSARTQANADFAVVVRLQHPEIERDFLSEHGAKVHFLKVVPEGESGSPQAAQKGGPPKPGRPEIVLHDVALADFSGGMGDSSPNQFRGSAGEGWIEGWQTSFSQDDEDAFSFEIEKDAAFEGGAEVLRVIRNEGGGFVKLSRIFDSSKVVPDALQEVGFQIRADEFTGSAEEPFLFTLAGYDQENAKSPSAANSAWCLVVDKERQTWAIYNRNDKGELALLNTRIPFEVGTVYSVKVHFLPAEHTFRITLQSDSQFYESPSLSSMSTEGTADVLSFGGWTAQNGPGKFRWSLGPVSIRSPTVK